MAKESPIETQYRIGIGYDVHRLVKDRKLILGGVRIDHPTGLLGHSDADVLTHAVMSAILGAMALGSLGDHFPDTDPEYKDIKSIDLLERVRIMMEESGYIVENLDAMVICDSPRLAPHVENIRLNLSTALRVPIERVSVKATSTEGLSFTGTGEGIAAQAVVLLKLPGEESGKTSKKETASGKKADRKKEKDKLPPPLPKIKSGELTSCVVFTDGATEDNPGPSGIGIVFGKPDGTEIGRLAEYIGEKTNNQAEYIAAIRAAEICRDWGIKEFTLRTDSKLMANQVNGSYKVKNPGILKLYQELMKILIGFRKWKVEFIRREKNMEADYLSKLGIRLKKRER